MQTPREEKPLYSFEDIIDGYFPLQVSLQQMLDRLGSDLAYVEIAHAPIMQIPGLPHDAPVPLNIQAGRAGVIDQLRLRVAGDGAVSGGGVWRWLDGSATEETLDPMTRLAEPAFLSGFCVAPLIPDHRKIAARAKVYDVTSTGATWGPFETEAPYRILSATSAPDRLQRGTEFLTIAQCK